MALVSFAKRLSDLAAADPDFPAVTCGGRTLSRGELERLGNRMARDLQSRGVGVGDFVTVALPNSVDWFVAYVGCWKLGAVPQPVSAKLPARELAEIVELAESKVVIGAEPDSLPNTVCLPVGYESPDDARRRSAARRRVARRGRRRRRAARPGRPKLIVSGDPSLIDDEAPSTLGFERDGCLVMPGPLYHNGPAVWSCQSLLIGQPRRAARALRRRGDARRDRGAPRRRRLPRADDDEADPGGSPTRCALSYDLSSLQVVWHLAEPCPAWLKEAWIDWLGAEKIFELYAGTEAQAVTVITGPEWLEHRGLGRPARAPASS